MGPNGQLWKGRRVLVTGHTGFKGAWLCAWLHRLGAQVLGYSQAPQKDEYPLFHGCQLGRRIRSHFGDVLDLTGLTRLADDFRPEAVLHLAAQPLVRKSYSEPVSTYATNVMGTVHVLELARLIPSVKAAVIITTDKCYQNNEWVWPYRETDRLGGHDPYSNSKACAELVVDAYRRSFLQAQGVLLASARAGNVIGGGDFAEDRLIPDAVRAFQAAQPLHIRSPHATRPWQHVLDPLRGYVMLAERLIQGEARFAEAFNFGPASEHTVGEVVHRVSALWGSSARVTVEPDPQHHEASRLHLDSSKATHLLGWRPCMELEQALERTIDFYRRWHQGEDPWQLMQDQLAELEATALGSA
jgi:CDP-glucose 4,6-dehydratase